MQSPVQHPHVRRNSAYDSDGTEPKPRSGVAGRRPASRNGDASRRRVSPGFGRIPPPSGNQPFLSTHYLRHQRHGQDTPRKLQLGRGLRPRIRGAALHLQRGRLRRALRAGGAEAGVRGRQARGGRAGRPRQPRGQRRDPRPGIRPRRARQRVLAGSGGTGGALAGALAAPSGVPRRVVGSARQRGRAGGGVYRGDVQLRLRPAHRSAIRLAAASRSSSRPSPPGHASRTCASPPEPRRGPW